MVKKTAVEFIRENNSGNLSELSLRVFGDRIEISMEDEDIEDMTELAESHGFYCEIDTGNEKLFETPRSSSKYSVFSTPHSYSNHSIFVTPRTKSLSRGMRPRSQKKSPWEKK
jgi:hypothetical protein